MADPNHVIWHEERVAFALPAKNANTTIKVAIMKLMGLEIPLTPENKVHNPKVSPLAHVRLEDVPATYDVVGVIRSPLERFWSAWHYLRRPDKNPTHTIRQTLDLQTGPPAKWDQHLRPQVCDLPAVDRASWLTVATLDEDWALLCAERGWPATPLTRENAGRFPYDAEAIAPYVDELATIYADDLALYEAVTCR